MKPEKNLKYHKVWDDDRYIFMGIDEHIRRIVVFNDPLRLTQSVESYIVPGREMFLREVAIVWTDNETGEEFEILEDK